MPWRLIGFIVIFGIFLAFTALNLQNACDINFGFRSFEQVPVFFTAFSSFMLGMLCAVPFLFSIRMKKKPKTKAEKAEPAKAKNDGISDGGPYGIN